jgi:quercetin dioxygenase-like cupin family protein
MLLMVSGRFRLDLTTGSVTLQLQGDYVVWGPGIDHSWQAEEDSVVVTVRWPSGPKPAVSAPGPSRTPATTTGAGPLSTATSVRT